MLLKCIIHWLNNWRYNQCMRFSEVRNEIGSSCAMQSEDSSCKNVVQAVKSTCQKETYPSPVTSFRRKCVADLAAFKTSCRTTLSIANPIALRSRQANKALLLTYQISRLSNRRDLETAPCSLRTTQCLTQIGSPNSMSR